MPCVQLQSNPSYGSPAPSALIKSHALQLGFHKVGIVAAEALSSERERFSEWLRRGFHGEMKWMARDPEQRYASAKDMAYDLEHQDEVSVVEPPKTQETKRRLSSWQQDVCSYAPLGLIPILLFTLLFYVARHP